jgi:glutamyl-tRNA reductase
MSTQIVCLGLSHHTAPIELRERLNYPTAALEAALAAYRDAGLGELVILSTCNRLELYGAVSQDSDLDAVFTSLVAFIAATRGLPAADLSDKLYRLAGSEAIEHLGRVAAGLDSMVLGEPQILGQVAAAMELAAAQRAAGPVLSALFRAAVHAGKRARAETGISRNPTTISSIAVRLAEKAAGSLAERQVLIVGAGQMAGLAVQALRGRGALRLTIANRTLARAADLAERWGARAWPLDDLGAALADADIALAATNAPDFVITPAVAGPALAARPERPLVLIDIAVPRDVDPGVRRLPNVRYYDIDDLEAHLNGALDERQQAVPRVQAIVAEEMRRFSAWLSTLAVAPVIADLRAKADAIRRAEVDKTLRRLPNLTAAERQQIENLAEALVNKLLHEPTGRLKAEAGTGHAAEYAAAVRDLFALNG